MSKSSIHQIGEDDSILGKSSSNAFIYKHCIKDPVSAIYHVLNANKACKSNKFGPHMSPKFPYFLLSKWNINFQKPKSRCGFESSSKRKEYGEKKSSMIPS